MITSDQRNVVITELTGTLYSGDVGVPHLLQSADYWVKLLNDSFNKRLNVQDYGGDLAKLVYALYDYGRDNQLGKVILKAHESEWESFLSLGFSLEGLNKYYFNGEYGYFMAKFLDPKRRYSEHLAKEDEIMEKVTFSKSPSRQDLAGEFEITDVEADDIEELAALFDKVFDTYPTPLNDPDYLHTLWNGQAIFQVVRHQGKIVSASSAVIDKENSNAELTDCATLPDYRGQGLMSQLISSLENILHKRKILCFYGMARSLSFGMNLLFKRHGYKFQGRLINHCNIMGKLEDVNLWVKTSKKNLLM